MDSSPSLEALLEPRSPSAVTRLDGELAAQGIPAGEVAATKIALAALGTASVDPDRPPPSLRERLLTSARRPGRYGLYADRVARLFDVPVETAAALLAKVEEPDGWMPFLVDGLELMAAPVGPKCEGAIATLVKLQPGKSFPHHSHHGEEVMLVLDGGFRELEQGGLEVWRGDELCRADSSAHSFVALPGVPCVAAVVIFGHTHF